MLVRKLITGAATLLCLLTINSFAQESDKADKNQSDSQNIQECTFSLIDNPKGEMDFGNYHGIAIVKTLAYHIICQQASQVQVSYMPTGVLLSDSGARLNYQVVRKDGSNTINAKTAYIDSYAFKLVGGQQAEAGHYKGNYSILYKF